MLNNLIAIFSEILEDNDSFHHILLQNYMKYFEKPKLNSKIIKLLAWVLIHAGARKFSQDPNLLNSIKEGLKILMYMKNSDSMTQCWILTSFQALLKIEPKFAEELVSFLTDFK